MWCLFDTGMGCTVVSDLRVVVLQHYSVGFGDGTTLVSLSVFLGSENRGGVTITLGGIGTLQSPLVYSSDSKMTVSRHCSVGRRRGNPVTVSSRSPLNPKSVNVLLLFRWKWSHSHLWCTPGS